MAMRAVPWWPSRAQWSAPVQAVGKSIVSQGFGGIMESRRRGGGGNENPNRDLDDCGCARCGLLDPLHLRNVTNSAWNYVDSGLSDLSHCAGSPLRLQFLFRPSCQCCYVCVGRFDRGNHAAAALHQAGVTSRSKERWKH